MPAYDSECVIDLLRLRTRQNPHAIAVLSPAGDAMTYLQLFSQVEQTVARLNALGIERNDRVAIVLPNGPEMAVAFLSIAAGAASAPLNPAYGQNEFAFYLADLQARALVIQAGMESPARQVAQEMAIPVFDLVPRPEVAPGAFVLQGEVRPLTGEGGWGQAQDVALVLHTSGTTARPKMVPLTQANICTSAQHIRTTLALTGADRCLNVMPLFHIHGLMAAVLASVSAGASIVCTPGFDAGQFFEWLDACSPTWVTAVPTMHQSILDRAAENLEVIARRHLRFLRSSSASLPPTVMAELERIFAAPVIESYGMTEAAHQMASNRLPPRLRKPGSVGPAAGPEVAILDEAGNFLPAAARGEIAIRGPDVMHGYVNNSEANQKAFTHGWFRTGDQGYLDQDGYLFITGRLKEMINRGGEKVAPREVDEALLQHPAVAQAVTFAVPHTTLGEDVAAAVVLKENAVSSEKELRDYSFQLLAVHKVPSRVIIVDQIPKGPTGKVQRIGLYEKLAGRMQPEFRAPQDELEQALVNMFAQVLGMGEKAGVGTHDNFFALGGDSLRAMQLIARVRVAFQIDLPTGTIFRHPTVNELALVIEDLLLSEIEHLPDGDLPG
jgi:acyl-CoA synthetase (AMP-forming)/AMP-acid ligase II/acyl carrier protein